MKQRLERALKEMQRITDELQSEEKDFAAKKSDWYGRSLMLNYSGLMDDAEFGTNVWNVYHKELSEEFDSAINTLRWAMEGFLKRYEAFEKANAYLSNMLANEQNRVPEGWLAYKVKYNEKGCSVEQEFYCFAPDEETAYRFCKEAYGRDVLSVNSAELLYC